MTHFIPRLSRRAIFNATLLLTIILAGVLSRIWLVDFPNFKPVASLALFTGFYFRRWLPAAVGVLSIMVISDVFVGAYDWPIMISVYASMVLAGGLGCLVANKLRPRGAWQSTAGCLASALTMSTTFFLLTNTATWLCWYDTNLSGLIHCFWSALPFYRATLASDFLFTSGWVLLYHVWIVYRDSKISSGLSELTVRSTT